MENKDTIDISCQNYHSPESFREAAADCIELINDILISDGDIPAKEVANRTYFLHWIVRDVEIVQEQHPIRKSSTTHLQ